MSFPQPINNHLQRYIADDWKVSVQVKDPTGRPVDLSGYQLYCEFTSTGAPAPQTLSVNSGGIVIVGASQGQFDLLVPGLATRTCLPLYQQLALGLSYPRAKLYWFDSLGARQTIGVMFFDVFDGSEDIAINDQGGVQIVWQDAQFILNVAATQGPPGPNTITAGSITDASNVGISILKAASYTQVLALIGALGGVTRHVSDQDYTVLPGDAVVIFDKLSATRTVTLAQPQLFGFNRGLVVMDGSGSCSPGSSIHVVAPTNIPSTSCTIKGQPSFDMQGAYDRLELSHNETNLWVF